MEVLYELVLLIARLIVPYDCTCKHTCDSERGFVLRCTGGGISGIYMQLETRERSRARTDHESAFELGS